MQNCLHGRIAALCATRRLAYLVDMSRLLCCRRLALHPVRLVLQRSRRVSECLKHAFGASAGFIKLSVILYLSHSSKTRFSTYPQFYPHLRGATPSKASIFGEWFCLNFHPRTFSLWQFATANVANVRFALGSFGLLRAILVVARQTLLRQLLCFGDLCAGHFLGNYISPLCAVFIALCTG